MHTQILRQLPAEGRSVIPRRLVLAGLGWAITAPSLRAQTSLKELTIPVSSFSFASASVRAAHSLGLFAKRGLNPKFVAMESGNAATAALISGATPVVVSGPGELVAARARGQPIVIIADVYRGFGASLALSAAAAARTGVSPSAPATDRLKALDGLVIASSSATSSYTVSYKGAAEAVGAKIRFTYIAQPAMAAALESGAIQGMIASAPFWGFPVARGAGVLWLSGPKGDLPPEHRPASTTSFQAMRSFAEENPGLMRDIIEVPRDFGVLVRTRPNVVRDTLASLYPTVDAATMDVLFAAESQAWETQPLTVEDMQHEIDFVRSGGTSLPGLDQVDPAAMLYHPPA